MERLMPRLGPAAWGAIWAALVAALPAEAQDADAWNAERAEIFSEVCMGGAPGFDDLGRRAAAADFRSVGGRLLHEPEVYVSLLTDGRTCTCYMTMGAPDPNSIVVAVFQRLVADFPGAWAPGSPRGSINDTSFVRDGVAVRLLLRIAEVDGSQWLDARIVAEGECPA